MDSGFVELNINRIHHTFKKAKPLYEQTSFSNVDLKMKKEKNSKT